MAEFRATSAAAAPTGGGSRGSPQAHKAAEADETASAAVHTKDGEDDTEHDPGAAPVGVVHVEAAIFRDKQRGCVTFAQVVCTLGGAKGGANTGPPAICPAADQGRDQLTRVLY